MTDLRFAVFGAGFWAPFQIAGWQEVKGAKCVAIYNRTVSKAEKVAQAFGIPAVYGDPEDLLDREKLDFLDVITDGSTHCKYVQMAAQAQVAGDLSETDGEYPGRGRRHGAGAAGKQEFLFLIHENWRWQAQIRELKKVLDSGEIGVPFRARIFLVSGYPVFNTEPSLKDLEEYILKDLGTHLLDVARFLFGEADRLYCQTHQIHKGIKGEDVATVMMHMGGRTTVTCYMGFAGNYPGE